MDFTKSSILIAPSSMHQALMKQVLNNQEVVAATTVTSLSVYLKNLQLSQQPHMRMFALAFSIIQENKQYCTILKDTLHYPEVVKQLFDAAYLLHQTSFEPDNLPNKTAKQQEIALLLKSILPTFKHHLTLDAFKKMNHVTQPITIYPSKTTLTEQMLVDVLIDQKATLIQPPTDKQQRLARVALNVAQEASAIVQYVLSHPNEKIVVCVCDAHASLQALLAATQRAKITVKQTQPTKQPTIIKQFKAFITHLHHPTIESFKAYLLVHTQQIDQANDLLRYIELFDLSIDQCQQPFTHVANTAFTNKIIDKRDVLTLQQLETRAELARRLLIGLFNQVPERSIVGAYEAFALNSSQLDINEQKALLQIKEIIEQVWPTPNSEEDKYRLMETFMDQITVDEQLDGYDLLVTTLAQPFVEPADTFILMAANQRFFPHFIPYKGIIDESYIEQLGLIPLEDRLQHHTDQLFEAFAFHKKVIVSYSNATFEGKLMTFSVALRSWFKDEEIFPWPQPTIGKKTEITYQLDPTIAESLFFKNKQLHGSVSSFERYFQCPTKYYYQSGLKLSKKEPVTYNSALIGTIAHAVFEQIVKQQPKAYGLVETSTLTSLLQDLFEELQLLYPHLHEYWHFVMQQLVSSLRVTLGFADGMERNTTFQNIEVERRFEQLWPINKDVSIVLRGIIDRIDQVDDLFRIIDYKSSSKTLSFKQVAGGLQLQLLTYLVVAKKLLQLTPSGAYYFSLQNNNISIAPKKVSRSGVTYLNQLSFEQAFIKEHKLKGWFVTNDVSMYADPDYVANIGNDKVWGQPFELDKIESLLTTIYSYLAAQLQAGNIQRRPVANACQYCDFKNICVYTKTVAEPLAFLTSDKQLKAEKE